MWSKPSKTQKSQMSLTELGRTLICEELLPQVPLPISFHQSYMKGDPFFLSNYQTNAKHNMQMTPQEVDQAIERIDKLLQTLICFQVDTLPSCRLTIQKLRFLVKQAQACQSMSRNLEKWNSLLEQLGVTSMRILKVEDALCQKYYAQRRAKLTQCSRQVSVLCKKISEASKSGVIYIKSEEEDQLLKTWEQLDLQNYPCWDPEITEKLKNFEPEEESQIVRKIYQKGSAQYKRIVASFIKVQLQDVSSTEKKLQRKQLAAYKMNRKSSPLMTKAQKKAVKLRMKEAQKNPPYLQEQEDSEAWKEDLKKATGFDPNEKFQKPAENCEQSESKPWREQLMRITGYDPNQEFRKKVKKESAQAQQVRIEPEQLPEEPENPYEEEMIEGDLQEDGSQIDFDQQTPKKVSFQKVQDTFNWSDEQSMNLSQAAIKERVVPECEEDLQWNIRQAVDQFNRGFFEYKRKHYESYCQVDQGTFRKLTTSCFNPNWCADLYRSAIGFIVTQLKFWSAPVVYRDFLTITKPFMLKDLQFAFLLFHQRSQKPRNIADQILGLALQVYQLTRLQKLILANLDNLQQDMIIRNSLYFAAFLTHYKYADRNRLGLDITGFATHRIVRHMVSKRIIPNPPVSLKRPHKFDHQTKLRIRIDNGISKTITFLDGAPYLKEDITMLRQTHQKAV